MRRILMATKTQLMTSLAVLAVSAFAANAADLAPSKVSPVYKAPPAPMYSWTGFYIGAYGGGGWGRSRDDFSAGTSTGSFNTSGGFAGATLGANWQTGQWVLGLETDGGWAGFQGSVACPAPDAGLTCKTSDSWLGTTRARVGWTPGPVLLYGTGGAAYGDVKAAVTGLPGATSTRAGWAAGAGVEWMFAPKWSVKAEYLHVDLGSMTCGSGLCAPAGVTDSVKFNVDTVRAGINFKFY
jgi:outer membrane immunogenic protein